MRTKRPAIGPASSVAIAPAADVTPDLIGFARDFLPSIDAAATDAAEPAAAAAAPQAAQAPAKASGGPESANRRPSRSRVAAGGSSGTAAPAAAHA
ncbi:MAG: hypothetical protein N2423_10650, partial [Novosphingobium sp.]|nr:hypothetical protein [Novosphingobium sp.]